MAYTDIERIEARSGVDLSAEQEAEATRLIPAAELFIDQYTGVHWPLATTVSAETQRVYSNRVRLSRPPIASVETVRLRSAAANDPGRVLDASEYELADALRGVLLLPYGAWPAPPDYGAVWRPIWGPYVQVSYTREPLAGEPLVDPRVELAATELVLYWLTPLLYGGGASSGEGPSTGGGVNLPAGPIKSYSVGGDLSVTFADAGESARFGGARALGVPASITGLLDSLSSAKASFA